MVVLKQYHEGNHINKQHYYEVVNQLIISQATIILLAAHV